MTSTPASTKTGEFARIAQFFAPLAAGFPGAFALTDDAAAIAPQEGHELVVTTDTIVEGIHFIGDETPTDVAKKLLRVSLSDLASMGARPLAYTLNIALPKSIDDAWLGAFCSGLQADQEVFELHLIGGDSVSTPGPVVLTVTAFGESPADGALRRNGAHPGDRVFVSGTIGDATLGLRVAKGEQAVLAVTDSDALLSRYRCPQPRVPLGLGIRGVATACADVSDGLAADLEHIAAASEVGICVNLQNIPLSSPAADFVAGHSDALVDLVSGGDDYELVFTVPTDRVRLIADLARDLNLPLTEIGVVEQGRNVRFLDENHQEVKLPQKGFTHQ